MPTKRTKVSKPVTPESMLSALSKAFGKDFRYYFSRDGEMELKIHPSIFLHIKSVSGVMQGDNPNMYKRTEYLVTVFQPTND